MGNTFHSATKLLRLKWLTLIAAGSLLTACAMAPQIAPPTELAAPAPVEGNTGKFMSPYTSDGTVSPWVEKAINAKMGATIGATAGVYAGQKLMENVPFFGGLLGQQLGEAAGRKIALEASGGEEFIRSSSDLSFDSIDDMAIYLYVKHSSHPNYQDALAAAQEIYPELKQRYGFALQTASNQIRR